MGNLPKVVVENKKSIPSMCSPPNISKQIKTKAQNQNHTLIIPRNAEPKVARAFKKGKKYQKTSKQTNKQKIENL